MIFPRIAPLHLPLAWALLAPAFSCPYCRIENHLHTAVPSADHIAVVEVLEKTNDREWRAVVREIVKKQPKTKIRVGDLMKYEDRFQVGRPGEVMLAFGPTMSAEAVYKDLLPLDLRPEIERILRPESYPASADEAAEYLTSVSCYQHEAGGIYYKLHPLEVQEALIRRLPVLTERALSASSPYYVSQQLRCGLMALLRIRTALSDEQIVREIDEFLQISQKPPSQEALYLSMARLETVFSLIADQPRNDDRRSFTLNLLASVQERQLSRVSQCLLISDLMSPDAILQARPRPQDAPWIKEAVVLAGILRFNAWDRKTAAVLAQKAKTIPGYSADTELAALTAALAKEDYPNFLSVQGKETPDDAGWYSYSSLFDLASWDKVPMTPPAQAHPEQNATSLEIIVFGTATAVLLFLIVRLFRKLRAAQ